MLAQVQVWDWAMAGTCAWDGAGWDSGQVQASGLARDGCQRWYRVGSALAPVLELARDRLEGGLREMALGWDKFASLSLSNREKRFVFFFK